MPKDEDEIKCKEAALRFPRPVRSSEVKLAKQHGMIKRTNKFLRNARGTTALCAADAKIIKGFMPYDR